MKFFSELLKILEELLDIESNDITEETYLIRDLGAESIDLLELSVAINNKFKIDVIDDDIFLIKFREYLFNSEKDNLDKITFFLKKYPFQTKTRIKEILNDIDNGPALKIKDVINYIKWKYTNES